ncbi:hypothetical protein SAMN03159353_101540 [Cedecea sp. NFIX57]|nr:hypothetical protein SAMN03159353_101540 [Cedecea sp. NFIX57]
MDSFREQLRKDITSTTKNSSNALKKKIHKFIGKFTITDQGYCDYDIEESNPFLLKFSRNDFGGFNGIMQQYFSWCKIIACRGLCEFCGDYDEASIKLFKAVYIKILCSFLLWWCRLDVP